MMGYLLHEFVIAEFDANHREEYAALEAWRDTLEPEWKALVVGPVDAITNAYVWWILLPDGSKEGWPDSDKGDEIRRKFNELADSKWWGIRFQGSFGDDGPQLLGPDIL